jgi:DNA-binding beta-propeller fold protein YncE
MRPARSFIVATILMLGIGASTPTTAQIIGMVADNQTRSVTVFDATNNIVIGSVPLPATLPGALVGDCSISRDQTRGYVTDFNNQLHVIDLTKPVPRLASGINPIPISNRGEDTVFTPDGRFLIGAGAETVFPFFSVVDVAAQVEIGSGNVTDQDHSSIDICSDGTVLATSFLSSSLHRATISASGDVSGSLDPPLSLLSANGYCAPGAQSGIVLDFNARAIQSFSLPGLVPVDSRKVRNHPQSAVINSAGDRAYVRSFAGEIDVFGLDSVTGTLSDAPLFSFDTTPSHTRVYLGIDHIAISPDGSKLYIGEANQLSVYDAANGKLLTSMIDEAIVEPTGVCLGQGKPPTDNFLLYKIKKRDRRGNDDYRDDDHDHDDDDRRKTSRRRYRDDDDDDDDDRSNKGRRNHHDRGSEKSIALSDIFDVAGQSSRFELEDVERFGNPVEHEFRGDFSAINDADTRLIAYEIDEVRSRRKHSRQKHTRLKGIVVTNQIGELSLDTKKAERLLVPAMSDLSKQVSDAEQSDQVSIDFFKCYRVDVTRNTQSFARTQISVADAFGPRAVQRSLRSAIIE